MCLPKFLLTFILPQKEVVLLTAKLFIIFIQRMVFVIISDVSWEDICYQKAPAVISELYKWVKIQTNLHISH